MNLLLCCLLLSAEKPSELECCRMLAPKYQAKVEVRLWDDTRCDLVTATQAIEVDWAPKWAEAVGQALYYGTVLNKEPTIILLVVDLEKERRYVYRCQTVAAQYKIKLYVERVDSLTLKPEGAK